MDSIFGRKPVFEAIVSGIQISKILIARNAKGEIIDQIKSAAEKENIRFQLVDENLITKYSTDKNTQGVVAFKKPVNLLSFDELISSLQISSKTNILLLENIQDTHNLGAILRTAESAGTDAVLLTTTNSAPLNDTVSKTSAGAVYHLKIAKINNVNNTLKILKQLGFWIIGTSLKSDKTHFEIKYDFPAVIIVGNEEKGIKKLTEDNCDFLVKIPMLGKIQSLNVSVSTGIILYEILRQKA